jgi:hypothetical protein
VSYDALIPHVLYFSFKMNEIIKMFHEIYLNLSVLSKKKKLIFYVPKTRSCVLPPLTSNFNVLAAPVCKYRS